MKYLILNLLVTCVVIGVLILWRAPKPKPALWKTLLALIILTALFDSLIIWSGIVDYNYADTLGIRIWRAPIEDFFYTVVAVIGSISLWEKYDQH